MENLLDILKAACGQHLGAMKEAEAVLKGLEEKEGFFSALLDIYFCKEFDVNIRWMAILCFKNGVIRNWKRIKNGVSDAEKNCLRSKLILSFDEEHSQLALQQAVVIGHIVRSDVRQWPESIQKTLESVRSESSLVQHRSLLTLNQIIKQLASKRLMADRKIFEEISQNIFDILFEWSRNHFTLIEEASDFNMLAHHLDLLYLITKITRKLLIQGARKYEKESLQMKYMIYGLTKVKSLLNKLTHIHDGSLKEKIEKEILLIMKIVSDFLETHPMSFSPLIEFCLQICLEAIYSHNSNFERYTIICSNILRTIVKTFKKNNSENNESFLLIEKILTVDIIENLVSHLIMNYFPITQLDMEEWLHSPEEYMLVEAGESHKFLLKPCMETLYLGLFYTFKSIIIPIVLKYVKETQSLNIAEIREEHVLKIAAIYKAVGLASYEMFDDLKFNDWFEQSLLPVLFNSDQKYLLLRQHIIWMVGEWVNVSFSKANRIRLYNIIAMFLSSPHQDLVMKLTACKTLRIAIDDFDFSVDDFSPYMNTIFIAAVDLLVQVELCDTKMSILNVLSIMIERIGDKVRDNANLLLQYLPKLWEISEAHNLLRGAVVNVLTHLVKGLESQSEKVQDITLPIIMFSTSITQDAHIYLMEDGLELWVSVLEMSPKINIDLLNLYGNILPLLERASETFEICLHITKLYIQLDANTFLEKFGKPLCELFMSFIGNIQEQSTVKILEVLRLAVQSASTISKDIFYECHLRICGILYKDESYCPLIIEIISIFSYLLLYHPVDFQRILETCHEQTQIRNFETFMGKFLDIWLEKVDFMGLIEKKLSAMALVSLLPQKASFVFERFGLILDFCVNVLFDLQRNTNDMEVTDSLVVNVNSNEAVENPLKQKMVIADPVYSVVLINYISEKLKETRASYGEKLFKEGMEFLDMQVANQLYKVLHATF